MRHMLELFNFANAPEEINRLFGGKKENLVSFIEGNNLDGMELMACEPLQEDFLERRYIKGSHLIFWPTWFGFWRQDEERLRRDIGNDEAVRYMYGTENVREWLGFWRDNIRRSVEAGAEYLVFHIAESEPSALSSRQFTVTDEEIVGASVELVNSLCNEIPEDCLLLFENLWWPGLTLLKPRLMEKLLESVRHKNCGFMMDTGHLMNTNLELRNEAESVDYVLDTYSRLGELQKYVRGIHLHQSQSGEYVKAMMSKHIGKEPGEIFEYIRNVDRHLPFRTTDVKRIVEEVQPEYLVHEFLPKSTEDWNMKLAVQRHALGFL